MRQFPPAWYHGWPFPPSASASIFYRCFCSTRVFFSWESLHKMLINTVFCVQLSQFEFPHAYAFFLTPFPPPNSHVKPPGRCPNSNFRISLLEKLASHRSGKTHSGNFCTSAPQLPRSVNGQNREEHSMHQYRSRPNFQRTLSAVVVHTKPFPGEIRMDQWS